MKQNSKKSKWKIACVISGVMLGITCGILKFVKKKDAQDEDLKKDLYEGAGEPVGYGQKPIYEAYIKRGLDIILALLALIPLTPVLGVISLLIFIDDPGPVIFTQKRVGINKTYFKLYKFRSMKMSTPHDVPTHQLENPEQYITRVGRFLRKSSLDELPQIWNILKGEISWCGPRPALWNQEDLVAERDKYEANDVKPGLTGWAQINGRDELEIPVKARYDGEYVRQLRKSSLSGFIMDVRCFVGTILSVVKSDGVVEGGTGEIHKAEENAMNDSGHIGFANPVTVDYSKKRKVLITGANSYIGESFEQYARQNYGTNFEIDTIDMQDEAWRDYDFVSYDIVFHVAGIAHADVGNVSEETKKKYYAVNTDLAVETAEKAKAAGVGLFVFMSSMIVYGDSAPYGKSKMITAQTRPQPANFYGDSKWQADQKIRALADDSFHVAVLRPPMIYGKGSKGNYQTLAKLAKKLPVFPNVKNERSMLYIDNLCEFLCQMMLVENKAFDEHGNVFMPQNREYTQTSEMVREIAKSAGKKTRLTRLLNPAVVIGSKMPGKIGGLVNKAFGNSCYEMEVSKYEGIDYQRIELRESIIRTEMNPKKRVLMLASVASMIDQFNMSNITILQELGYKVDVACNFEKGSTCSPERIEDLKQRLSQLGVDYYQIDFTRSVMNLLQDWKSYKQVKKLVKERKYNFIHCHSPIGGVIGRLVAHKMKTKVIYTAHGFHFYDGAPKKNWMIYYPIEKFLSKWTDVLITINKEDYIRAKKKLHAKKTVYIPGVGVDTEKFDCNLYTKEEIENCRNELGVPSEAKLLLSVGELNENKNHEIVIKALAELERDDLYYIVAGAGVKEAELKKLISDLQLNERIQLLGYRDDIALLYEVADVYILPSKREGLNVSLMEAMASAKPCVVSRIRGNTDLIDAKGGYLFEPQSVEACKIAIISLISKNEEEQRKQGIYNRNKIKHFDVTSVNMQMEQIYIENG